ncbi:helix-turn-helix transcriptional regulator [Brevibacillus sp. HB1.4B]|uniref:helix-turn-helix domain-containing protein n=1 Tax=Brevibacillus sp. HB1.4B TaxID=2738845 RepID=UPI0020C37903|nr:helix-turn-helix transcriptional regulator [Brevibacillus sp. HB1.4B]
MFASLEYRRIRKDKVEDNTLGISLKKETPYSPFLDIEDDSPGGRLRAARTAKQMYLVDLAAATGLCTRTIGLAEANKLKVSPPSLRRLSKVLGVSVAFLGCFEKLPESSLGERIIKARLYYGYTKREFAALLGISERTLYEWEHDRKIPPTTPLNDLSKYLDILMKE